MTVTVRFAPSPTGYLHIGGARTALFNWLFARHHGGRYLLRIEDTDRARSTEAAIQAIGDGLRWLGLEGDEPAVLQSASQPRHAEIAHALLAQGAAYHCYSSPEQLAAMRERQRAEARPQGYDGTWRDRDPSTAPQGAPPVVRLRAPREGETVIQDLVQGEVRVANEQLDDLVLLRADGTPTYMLSVVVDDHDMAVTHVIRGDDHLTNAFRQTQIYRALGWEVPAFAHIPMIHGPDGAKLSKRHGALGIDAYREMGYLPEAIVNYLLRLGWSHGDDEIISREQAVTWFDLAQVGRSPSRFDFAKLENLNGHYLREAPDERLASMIWARLGIGEPALRARLVAGMAGLKLRAKTINELAESARFYVASRPIAIDAKAAKLLTTDTCALLTRAAERLAVIEVWSPETVEVTVRELAENSAIKLGALAQPLRAALTGSTVSPGVFEVAAVLGRHEVLARIEDAVRAAISGPAPVSARS